MHRVPDLRDRKNRVRRLDSFGIFGWPLEQPRLTFRVFGIASFPKYKLHSDKNLLFQTDAPFVLRSLALLSTVGCRERLVVFVVMWEVVVVVVVWAYLV